KSPRPAGSCGWCSSSCSSVSVPLVVTHRCSSWLLTTTLRTWCSTVLDADQSTVDMSHTGASGGALPPPSIAVFTDKPPGRPPCENGGGQCRCEAGRPSRGCSELVPARRGIRHTAQVVSLVIGYARGSRIGVDRNERLCWHWEPMSTVCTSTSGLRPG